MRAFTPHKDQIAPATPADVVPVAIPTETPATGTPSLGSAPLGATHTPGPWSRVPQTRGGDLIARKYETGDQMNPKGLRLVAFMMARGDSLPEDEANALLISLAPELAEALRVAHQFISNGIEFGYIRMPNKYSNDPATKTPEMIRALLSKLKGST